MSFPSTVFGCTSTISRFGERFRDAQYSLVIRQFLVCCFSTHGTPRAQPFLKVGARATPGPHGVGATEY